MNRMCHITHKLRYIIQIAVKVVSWIKVIHIAILSNFIHIQPYACSEKQVSQKFYNCHTFKLSKFAN